MISSRPAVAELGAALTLLMIVAALLAAVLVPAMARWIAALAEPGGSKRRSA
jgi:predicted RND superfamily exporter protein